MDDRQTRVAGRLLKSGMAADKEYFEMQRQILTKRARNRPLTDVDWAGQHVGYHWRDRFLSKNEVLQELRQACHNVISLRYDGEKGVALKCFENVRRRIAAHGGKPVLEW